MLRKAIIMAVSRQNNETLRREATRDVLGHIYYYCYDWYCANRALFGSFWFVVEDCPNRDLAFWFGSQEFDTV